MGQPLGPHVFASGVHFRELASAQPARRWATGSNGHAHAAYTNHRARIAVGGRRIVRPNPPIKPTASGV